MTACLSNPNTTAVLKRVSSTVYFRFKEPILSWFYDVKSCIHCLKVELFITCNIHMTLYVMFT